MQNESYQKPKSYQWILNTHYNRKKLSKYT